MAKYYRLLKDNDLVEAGAIYESQADGGYKLVEDIWYRIASNINWQNKSAAIVEAPENTEWYERVYKDSISGNIFRTADQMKKLYKDAFKGA